MHRVEVGYDAGRMRSILELQAMATAVLFVILRVCRLKQSKKQKENTAGLVHTPIYPIISIVSKLDSATPPRNGRQ